MTASGYEVHANTWVASGNGMTDASNTLASAVNTLCSQMSSAGACWGSDDIGRAFFNGDGESAGFGAARDGLLAQLADMVNVVRATGGMLRISGHNYRVADEASTIGSALPAGADQGAIAAVDPYRLPEVSNNLVTSDPPPSELMQIAHLVETLVGGCQWPDGDLNGLTTLRDALSSAAGSVTSVAQVIDGHASAVTTNNAGEATQKFASFAAALQGGGEVGGLSWLSSSCQGLANWVDTLIRQKKAARIQFILSLTFLLLTWAIALAASWISAGTSVAAATATTEAEGLVLRTFLQRVAKSVLMGAVFGGTMDGIGQYSRIHEGLQKGFDAGEFLKATGEGAVAGGVMGGAGAWLGSGSTKFTSMLSDAMKAPGFNGGLARFGVNGLTGTAGNVAAQAAFDKGHVDLGQAAQFGFGMAGIEGFKEAGLHYGGLSPHPGGQPPVTGEPAGTGAHPDPTVSPASFEPHTGNPTTVHTGNPTTGHAATSSNGTGGGGEHGSTGYVSGQAPPAGSSGSSELAGFHDTATGPGGGTAGAPHTAAGPAPATTFPKIAFHGADGTMAEGPAAPAPIETVAPVARVESPTRTGDATTGGPRPVESSGSGAKRPSVADILNGKTAAPPREGTTGVDALSEHDTASPGRQPQVEQTGSTATDPVHGSSSQHEGTGSGAGHNAGEQPSANTHEAPAKPGPTAHEGSAESVPTAPEGSAESVPMAHEAPGQQSGALGSGHGEPGPFQILADPGVSGDGYAAPGLWGKYGAAGALIRHTDAVGTERFLIVQRGPEVSSNVGKWQLPGGALESRENPAQGAAREISEELGAGQDYLDTLSLTGSHAVETPSGWTYTSLAAEAPEMFSPRVDGTETGAAKWVTAQELRAMSDNGELHSAFQKSLPDVMSLFDKAAEPAAPVHPGSPHENGPSSSPRSESPAAPGTSHGGASHEPAPPASEPAVMKDYTQVGGQSGSNVGGRFVDPAGKEWYVKAPVSDLHAKNEVLANDLYRAAGVPVPEVKLLDLNGNFGGKHLGVQSGIVEGSQNLGSHLNDSVYLDELHQNFAVDAWLGNWDSVGLVYDNVMATDSGLLRIDAGGSLLFRAQGGPKGELFSDTVGEIDTLRDPYINPQSAKVFEGVTDDHIRAGVAKIRAISEHQIDQMVDRHDFAPEDAAYLKDKIKARRNDLISRYGEPEPIGTHPAETSGTQPQVHAGPSNAHGTQVHPSEQGPVPTAEPSAISKALSGDAWPPAESPNAHGTQVHPSEQGPMPPAEPSAITKALSGDALVETGPSNAHTSAHTGSPHENGHSPSQPSESSPGPVGPHGGASHEPAPAAPPASEPAVMDGYSEVGGQAGSNVGGRFVDPAGKEWYVKAPVSDLHAKNEVLANDLYRAAGVPVPEVKLLDLNGNFGDRHLGVQSGIVEGSQNLGAHLNDPVYLDELHQNFAVDAWLGNWDSVGLVYDNVMATDSGLLRIDAGGSLLFRAQGGPKGPLFTDTVGEINSLRDPSINPQSAKVFEGVTDDHIRAGVAKIQAISEHQIDQMVDRHDFAPEDAAYLKDKIKARRNDLISRYGEPEPAGTQPVETSGTQLGQAHETPAQSDSFDIPRAKEQWANYWSDFAAGHPADYVATPTEPLPAEHGEPTQPLGDETPVESSEVQDASPVQDSPYTIPSDQPAPVWDQYGGPLYEDATPPGGSSEVYGEPPQGEPFDLSKQHEEWSKYWEQLAEQPTEPLPGEHGAPTHPVAEDTPVESPDVQDAPPVQDTPYTIPSDKPASVFDQWSKYADEYAAKHPVEEAGTPTEPPAGEHGSTTHPPADVQDTVPQDKPLNLPKWSDFWDSAKGKPVENPTWSPEPPAAEKTPTHPSADEHGAPTQPPATTHEPIDPSKVPTQPLPGDPTAATDPSAVHDATKNPMEAPNYLLPDANPSADPPIDSLQVPPSYGEKVWDGVVTNLSPEHDRAVKFYSASGYIEINEYLRSKDPNHVVDDAVKEHIARLAEVAKMQPVPHDIDVVRGVGSDAFSVPMRKLKGTVQSDAAFMSTSLGDKAAFSGKPVILHLRVPAGTPAVYLDRISSHPGERELLLGHGRRWMPTQVEIRKDAWGDKVYHVYGKILPD